MVRMQEWDAAGVTGIVWRRVTPGQESAAEEVMRQIMLLARQSEGYLGSEIFPPLHGLQDAYVVLYRFASAGSLRHWLHSDRRQDLLRKMEALVVEPSREFFVVHGRREAGTASSVFAYVIRPGQEAAFGDWRQRILREARTWPGFLGTESFGSLESSDPEFVVVVRFDNRPHLDAWLQSRARRAFMTEVGAYVVHYSLRRIGSGFEGWFDTSETNNPPASWRQAMVILTALYPVLMLMRRLLLPLFDVLPQPVAFLILLALNMAVLTYLVMPHFTRLMTFWLRPGPDDGWRKELLGWMILLGVMGLTLAISLFGPL